MTGVVQKAGAVATLAISAALLVTSASASSRATGVLIHAGVSGKGTLTSSPGAIKCPRHCLVTVAKGTTVRFVAHPAKGWKAGRWKGICPKVKKATVCTATASKALVVHVSFLRSRVAPKPQLPGNKSPAPPAPSPPPGGQTTTTTTTK